MNATYAIGRTCRCLVAALVLAMPAMAGDGPPPFDIAPFALPGSPSKGEVRFEEPRDVVAVEADLESDLPKTLPGAIGLSYLGDTWPRTKLERARDMAQPCTFGWTGVDDWYNVQWRRAGVRGIRQDGRRLRIEFLPLSREIPEESGYDVTFRRTVGLRLEGIDHASIRRVRVFTRSAPATTTLRVVLDAGSPTNADAIRFEGYNAVVTAAKAVRGCRQEGAAIRRSGDAPAFTLEVAHMTPSFRYSGDDGHVRIDLGREAFTISVPSLKAQGPIWYAEEGIFITEESAPTTFDDYAKRRDREGWKTVAARVREQPEQSYASAFLGQPRPHAAAWSLGFKNARQRFWQDPNGDITLDATTIRQLPAADTARYSAANGEGGGHGRFFFGLEGWILQGRGTDPAPSLASRLRARKDDVEIEQVSLAAPLDGRVTDGPMTGDRDLVCLARFHFRNAGDRPRVATLPIAYALQSGRSPAIYGADRGPRSPVDDWTVPRSPREPLSLDGGWIQGNGQGHPVVRARVETTMTGEADAHGLTFRRELAAGEECDLILKIPFLAAESPAERDALGGLDFDGLRAALAGFWRGEDRRGAEIRTPVPQLDALHRSHLSHVQISDPAMPGAPDLINTSVGTSTYSNFANESCMINEELDGRGLGDEARKRLEVWIKYQGTVGLVGRFTDHRGVLHGAGGFEALGSYNQNHGWILWRLAEHALYTRDKSWFEHAAPAMIAAADWVFRQRKETMRDAPSSRGWERGFLPAGAVEDVQEFRYWLTTNTMIWRGVDSAARTLEAFGHPESARVRREADAFGADLRRGFETMRTHCPLVRLRDGRWVPYYPSYLYSRGRAVGWIRETLEGSLYLILSGLYDSKSREAGWILDDFEDNRFLSPPYGYAIVDEESEAFSRGGISIQPNLLATLIPYLDRDEPEVYLWTFFNAWLSCYREEINAMVEHPFPVLGYSNTAHPKTSDEANAVMWLRNLFVYGPRDGLYLGRAIPRAWLGQPEPIGLDRAHTRWGEVSVRYVPRAGGEDILTARVRLRLNARPPKVLVRFRHPENRPIKNVTVNGRPHAAFDAGKQDVDVSGMDGELEIVARF
ncbi:hypothetical protein [Aquisphaera insulae]|uniref:hypothetical protein n=1 Tax=Aquisphaera insulae TaxID=2712864 RepID=UPI0013EADDC2|nr:hypothetical protein [Aquisphaera insulae]